MKILEYFSKKVSRRMEIVTDGEFCHMDCEGINPDMTRMCLIYSEKIKYDYKNQKGIFRCAGCFAEFPMGSQNSDD